jgi:hypothetical protein
MAITADVSDDLLLQMTQVIVQETEPERICLFDSHVRGEARPLEECAKAFPVDILRTDADTHSGVDGRHANLRTGEQTA